MPAAQEEEPQPILQTLSPGSEQTLEPDKPAPLDLAALAAGKFLQNADTVGWLSIPDTAIDDVVLWKPGDNAYYLRRNFDKRYSHNGVFYADGSSVFGEGTAAELGKNTVIYGHSMSDSRDDVQFGPLRYFLDEDFMQSHPIIHFSTLRENLTWEVVAAFYTEISLPYNSNTLTEEEFAVMFAEAQELSFFDYDYTYQPEDRFLTLSTCIYSLPNGEILPYPNEYRYAVMARLVE
jgi:sortase B